MKQGMNQNIEILSRTLLPFYLDLTTSISATVWQAVLAQIHLFLKLKEYDGSK